MTTRREQVRGYVIQSTNNNNMLQRVREGFSWTDRPDEATRFLSRDLANQFLQDTQIRPDSVVVFYDHN